MTGDRAAEMAFLLLALTLPLSALIARRMPLGETARMVAIWIVIIVGMVFVVTIAQGGVAKVKAWLWPGSGVRPTQAGMTIADAPRISVLHNIYYQDSRAARRV